MIVRYNKQEMKYFCFTNKYKKSGVSLLIAFICATIALLVVLGILTTVSRSLEQSKNLERSTQVFFAIESGLEAGFFHHNARGQGVSFEKFESDDFDTQQIISHEATTLKTLWTLDGRQEFNGDREMEGIIYEDAPLQFRWYWDNASQVSQEITPKYLQPNFTLGFTPKDIDCGENELYEDDCVIINWMLTRKTISGTSETNSLIPQYTDDDNPCDNDLFICKNNLAAGSAGLESINSDESVSLLPKNPETPEFRTSISGFLAKENTEYQLILTPLRPFIDTDQEVVPGLKFTFNLSQETSSLPRPDYTVKTRIKTNDFSRDLTLENIPEQTAIQAFSYAIFDD